MKRNVFHNVIFLGL